MLLFNEAQMLSLQYVDLASGHPPFFGNKDRMFDQIFRKTHMVLLHG